MLYNVQQLKNKLSTSQATAKNERRELVHQLYSIWCVSMFLCAHCSRTLWSTKNLLMHLLSERRDRLIGNIYRAIEHLRKLLSTWSLLHWFPSSPSWSFTKSANQKSTQEHRSFFLHYFVLYLHQITSGMKPKQERRRKTEGQEV